jgi:hypothetical protein
MRREHLPPTAASAAVGKPLAVAVPKDMIFRPHKAFVLFALQEEGRLDS